MSFEQILGVSDRNKSRFDRIVLENSGIAEPQNIRDAFVEAAEMGHPVLQRIHLSTLVRFSNYACKLCKIRMDVRLQRVRNAPSVLGATYTTPM
jgi:G3E family GTPase